MAVSGRKEANFRGSVSRGSAEDFDHCCEPCLSEGQHIEAFRYCADCQEYLCKNCVRYHQKTKVLKHHQLVEKDKADRCKHATSSSETYTEKCSTHIEEVVKFFCPEHEALGCTDCMTMDHRTCKLDYIPDKCKDVGKSQEYSETMKTLVEKLKHIDNIMKKATSKENEIETCHYKVVQEMVKFRKEINEHLDMLQRRIEADMSRKRSEVKQTIQTVVSTCSKISTDTKQLQSKLHSSQSAKENHQLFIALKQTKPKLQLDEVHEAEIILEGLETHYTLERNKYFNNILSELDIGKLAKVGKTSIQAGKAETLQHLNNRDVNVRTETDTNQCSIIGCSVLSDDKFVLSDFGNSKVKIVDIQKNVNDELLLDSNPGDLTVLSNGQIAVTVPFIRAILILTTSSRLKIIRKIDVKQQCFGVISHACSLFVLCHLPTEVLILDFQGNVKSKIPLRNLLQGTPYEIAYSRDQKLLYISDCTDNTITSISLSGVVRAVLTDNELAAPRGMLVLDDGSLLVCSKDNKAIYKLSGDFKQKQKIVHLVDSPCCIDFDKNRNEVLIGFLGNDMLKRFRVSYTS